MGFNLTAKGIVDERDRGCIIGVDGVREAAPVVVGVVGDDAACPGALRELAVGSIGVGRPFAVGIDLVSHRAGGDVVEPGGDVALRRGRRGLRPSHVAIRRHRGLVAEDVVGVANGVGRPAFVGLVSAKVVFIDCGVAERVGDRGETSKLVVGVGCGVAECIDGGGEQSEGIVFDVRCIATTVGVGDLATKGVVGNGVGYGGNGDFHQ